MRTSTRFLTNAVTTYLRLGTTFLVGLFSTWYVLGAAGVIGFGLLALSVSATGVTTAIERSIRFGLVRELAAAIASEDGVAVRRSVASAFRLCLQAAGLLTVAIAGLAAVAAAGLFNVPEELEVALVALIAAEGVHAGARLVSAPYLQSLFASQRVGLDNLLIVISRISYALSAVLVFGWLLPDAGLPIQLIGFAASRVSLQLVDVALGVALARRLIAGLRLERSAFDAEEYAQVRSTVLHTSQVALLLSLNHQFLAILINLFFGLTYNGIWQIGTQYSGFVQMASEGAARGVGPMATHLQQTGRLEQALALMSRSIRYQFAIALPTALLLGIYVYPLLELWVGDRLAGDPNLAGTGITLSRALWLTSAIAVLQIVMRGLRAGFFGVERVLYGIGKVHSYAWFAKWATVISLTGAAVLMIRFRTPVAAAAAMAGAHLLFSPVVVLRAAGREARLPILRTLVGSLTRPVLANLVLGAGLLLARPHLPTLTLETLAALVAGTGLVYGVLAPTVILNAGERRRLAELAREGFERLARR